MRVFLLVCCCLSLGALEEQEVRHLLDRCAFGGDQALAMALRGLDRAGAVDHLLQLPQEVVEPPAAVMETFDRRAFREGLADADGAAKAAAIKQRNREAAKQVMALKQWWLQQVCGGGNPVVERMALVWHDCFTSEAQKVKDAALLAIQHQTIRRHALGSYAELLAAMVHDPALNRYLDNTQNTARKPNENLARELFELFSLGEGAYSEEDIREAARALAGWTLEPGGRALRLVERRADTAEKTIFGETAAYDADALVAVILRQDACADYIARRLWIAFIDNDPEPQLCAAVADTLRTHDYQLAPALRLLWTSDAFWSPSRRQARICSPVELIVLVHRRCETAGFRLPAAEKQWRMLVTACKGLGQDPFDPPDVAGWPEGQAWIDSTTLLARQSLLQQLAKRLMRLRPLAAALSGDQRAGLAAALLPHADAAALADRLSGEELLLALLTHPAFQLI